MRLKYESARSRRARSRPRHGCRAAWYASTRGPQSAPRLETTAVPEILRDSVPRKLCAQISAGSPACRTRRLIIRNAVARAHAPILQTVLPTDRAAPEKRPLSGPPPAPPPRDTRLRTPAPNGSAGTTLYRPALLVEPEEGSPSLRVIVPQPASDTAAVIRAKLNTRTPISAPVSQAGERREVDPVEKPPRLLRGEHRRLALLHRHASVPAPS